MHHQRFKGQTTSFATFSDLLELRDLATEAEEKHYPDSPLLEALIQAIGDAEKCASVANQLVSVKVRTRYKIMPYF